MDYMVGSATRNRLKFEIQVKYIRAKAPCKIFDDSGKRTVGRTLFSRIRFIDSEQFFCFAIGEIRAATCAVVSTLFGFLVSPISAFRGALHLTVLSH